MTGDTRCCSRKGDPQRLRVASPDLGERHRRKERDVTEARTSSRWRLRRQPGRALALAIFFLAVLPACGAERPSGGDRPANVGVRSSQTVAVDGLSLELPAGWDAYTTHLGPGKAVATIWAASTSFVEASVRPDFPRETLGALPKDGIAIEIVAQPAQGESASWPLRVPPPVSLADGSFHPDAYEGQPAPHVSTQIIEVKVAGRALYVQVYFGRNQPDATLRARANRVLSSLSVAGGPSEIREDGFIRIRDAEAGLSARYPAGWYRARALTNLINPREVLALATYPLQGGAKAGECAPDTARAEMPPDGVFIWLLEYRPQRGEVWLDLPRDRFPSKPSRFEIPRGKLAENVSCFAGPGYSTTFRAADRPFQLLVAFGGRPSEERLAEVENILTSLRFEELPPPPVDPYAGWPLLNDNPGDSLEAPPNWAASAAMFPPGKTPRPRPLFFASNRPLLGLPRMLLPYIDELPGPFPAEALAGFPSDGVLLWVLEEEKGDASSRFPSIGRDWPAREQFLEVEPPTNAAAELRWLRVGGSFRGYRFSAWIGAGPEANDANLALALKSARSLAVSGCGRDVLDDCAD